ncbi:MAG TPA: conjugal transfer protein TrbL family protein [Chloroflexota bacterium]|nr:conjugal transfer protein TrbL family protein [Chloroflexota bacterium]
MSTVRLRSPCALLALAAVLVLLAAPPALGQELPPGPAPVATPLPEGNPPPEGAGSLLGFLPDPKQWAADVFNQVLVTLIRGISDALRRVVGGVLGSALNFITQTPPAGSYASPTVQTLWGVVRAIANAALAVVAMWGGFNLLAREHLGSPYHDAMELFPRLALGALLANTSLAWAQLAIDLNNALCQAVGEASLPAWEQADAATQQLVDVLAILIYLATSLLLLLQMLMRLALVDVLLVVAPLGLLCWVLPQTQGWARLWSATFFTAVFTQFVQVLALKLGGSLLTELAPMAPDAALLALFLGVAVLALTIKIPGLLRVHVSDGLSFARYYVYRQGARALEARGGASRAIERTRGGR